MTTVGRMVSRGVREPRPLTRAERYAMDHDDPSRDAFGAADSTRGWCRAIPTSGTVYIVAGQASDDLTPFEARELARDLLESADLAEFGPGEWRSQRHGPDLWYREVPE